MVECHVCHGEMAPDSVGKILWSGVTEAPKGKAWVWGPVPVHEACRLDLETPYDDRIGDGFILTWERVRV